MDTNFTNGIGDIRDHIRVNSRNGDGFSMIETLIVSALLMIAVSVYLAIWVAANANTSVNRTATASRIAERKMEELRGTPFSSLPASGPFSDLQLAELPSATASIAVADYLATSSIKQVSVSVSWQEGAGTRNYALESLFTDGGTNPP